MLDGPTPPPETKAEPKRNKGWNNLRPAKKGEVRNPTGRPKKDKDLAKLAQAHAEQAINTLVKVMSDDAATPSARVSAASEILDRGYGKAPQHGTLEHTHNFTHQFDDFIRSLMKPKDEIKQLEVIDVVEYDSNGSPETSG